MDKNIIQANDKYTVLQIVQGIFAQLNIPKRTLQIGDTFSVVNPVSIPIGNLKFDLKLTSLYKVISFDGIKAVLQIHQTYTIHSKVEGYAVTVSGNGDGNMEYLPAQQFFSKYQVQTNLQMKIKSSKMTIQLNSKNTMEQSCVVEANE